DVLAGTGDHRNASNLLEANARREFAISLLDLAESLFAELHQVHLVDRKNHAPDAHEVHDEAVPLSLRQNSFARVNEYDGQVAAAGPGCHVARILLVSGCVGD